MKNLICDLICSGRRRTVTRAGAGFVGLVLATLVAQPAYADCTPASASGVTAACTGATTNQGGGAPGTSAANNGYGTGAETGITVNVAAGATVTGNAAASSSGIFINNGTITNGSGATISGVLFAIRSDTVTVTNSGTVAGTGAGFGDGIYGASSLNVTNNAGAAITGWDTLATDGKATVRNFGTITSTGNFGIASGTADVINYAGATITAGAYGVYGHDGITVTNSGTITGTRIAGVVLVSGLATVTNLSGGIITGTNGIAADGRVNVTNSGTIASATVPFSGDGISARSGIVTNNAGATISGLLYGISFNFPDGGSSVYNAGFIDGGTSAIIFGGTGNTLTITPSATFGANVLGTGNDTLQLGGTGSGNFDMAKLGPVGAYQGFGVLNKIDSSTWTLFNSSSFSGPITISGGILKAGNSSLFSAASVVTVNSGGTLDFAGTAQTINSVWLAGGTIIAGSLTGAVTSTGGTINALGGTASITTTAGTTTLLGVNGYTGATIVNGGILDVEGSTTGTSSVTVNAGGTLMGRGTIDPPAVTIASGGTFAPGNGAPGTSTTIVGSLAFQAGALYLLQVNPSTASFANVTGTVALAGSVQAVLGPGNYGRKSYDILHSAGLGGTAFSGVTTNLPGFAPSLSYSATDVFLNLTAALGSGSGLNSNQQNAANAINNFFNTGSGALPTAFQALFALSGANLGNALTQLSGEGATASQQTTFDAMGQFMGLLTDPFMGRGNGINSATSPTGFTEENADAYAASPKITDAYAMFTKAPPAAPFVQRWSVWAAGYGGSQTTDGNAAVGSNDTRSSIFGTAVGADYLFSPNTLAGFALAGGGTNFSVNTLGSGRSDLFQAGAHVRHTNGAAYVAGALAYGWQDITTNRTVTAAGIDQLRAEFNANAYSGRVEGGYRFVGPVIGGVGITPYAAGQFTTFDLPAYAESVVVGSPNFALAYGAKSVTDTRSELGFRTDKSFAMANGLLTVRGRLAWAHDFDPDRSIGATFQALPGASFVVNGAAQASDSALTTASLEMKWTNNWSAAATFEGEFSSVTQSYAGKGVVRYAW